MVRLAPELDGFEVLYSNQHGHPKVGQELFSVNILFWALLDNGAFVGMIPWFDELIICTDLNCPSKGFSRDTMILDSIKLSHKSQTTNVLS